MKINVTINCQAAKKNNLKTANPIFRTVEGRMNIKQKQQYLK